MAGTLFLKECKQTLKSITYYIFLICAIVFFTSQMSYVERLDKPQPGAESYGTKYSEDESVIMEMSLKQLIVEMERNTFVTYPIGFYKAVTLSDEEMSKIYGILENVTDMDSSQLKNVVEKYSETMDETVIEDLKVKSDLFYGKFCSYFNEIDDILGGGSSYNEESLKENADVEITYEEALEDYDSILKEDKVSGAYARLFCDYMGIIMAILPVFLGVTRALQDRRAKADQVICSKGCSSAVLILSRYLAIVALVIVPLLLLSLNTLLQCVYIAESNGITADYFAFVKGIFGWLLPTVLFTVSIGFFFTELTNGPVAILLQGAFWFINMFAGIGDLVGHVGMNLIPRFNEVGNYKVFKDVFQQLVMNRVGYTIMAVILLIATIAVYEMKRKGRMNFGGKIFKHTKSES